MQPSLAALLLAVLLPFTLAYPAERPLEPRAHLVRRTTPPGTPPKRANSAPTVMDSPPPKLPLGSMNSPDRSTPPDRRIAPLSLPLRPPPPIMRPLAPAPPAAAAAPSGWQTMTDGEWKAFKASVLRDVMKPAPVSTNPNIYQAPAGGGFGVTVISNPRSRPPPWLQRDPKVTTPQNVPAVPGPVPAAPTTPKTPPPGPPKTPPPGVAK